MPKRSSVSYNQRGSDTNRCGIPAQSNRFILHCQPRDQVFWQYTTTWYRNNRFIDTRVVQRSDITSRFEAKRHTRCCWIVCTLFNEHGWGLDHMKLCGSGRTTRWHSIAQGHRRRHGLDTRCAPMRTDLPESWHWRKYALEAIIKLLFISLFHDKCLLFMLELY